MQLLAFGAVDLFAQYRVVGVGVGFVVGYLYEKCLRHPTIAIYHLKVANLRLQATLNCNQTISNPHETATISTIRSGIRPFKRLAKMLLALLHHTLKQLCTGRDIVHYANGLARPH